MLHERFKQQLRVAATRRKPSGLIKLIRITAMRLGGLSGQALLNLGLSVPRVRIRSVHYGQSVRSCLR
jgi:hypothetical protein